MYDFLLTFGVVLWLTVGFIYFRKTVASMYHPLTYYLLVHGLVFVIRPIVAYLFNYDSVYVFYQFLPTMEEKSIVLAGADLGFIVFAFTSLRFGNAPLAMRYSRSVEPMNQRAVRCFILVCAICLPIGTYSLYSTLLGTVGEMAMDSATGIVYNVSGNGYFYDAQLMVGSICVVFAWVFRFRIWAILPFLCYVAAKASTGARGPFIQAFISLILLYFYNTGRKWPTVKFTVPIVAMIMLFTVIGSNREVIRDMFTGAEITSQSINFSERPLEGMDYANMEYFEFIVHAIPAKTGTYGYFLDNLQLFTEPVPRALWHGKPLGPPIKMYELFNYGNPIGMTLSIPGEGWAQAGWIGIILWSGIFGAFYGKLYNLFVNSRQGVVYVSLYMVFLSASFVMFRNGVLLTIFQSSLFTLMPFILWGIIIRLQTSVRSKTSAY